MQQPVQALGVTDGLCSAHPDSLSAVVDAMDQQIEAPGAQCLCFELQAELRHQLADCATDGFGSTDRFSKNRSRGKHVGRATGVDRLRQASQCLIEPAGNLWAKAQGQRCARLAHHISDGLKTQPLQFDDDVGWQPECGDRQASQEGGAVAIGYNLHRVAAKAGCGVGGTPALSHGDTRLHPGGGKAIEDRSEHSFFTAMQMVGATAVDDKPVRRVSHDDGGDTLQRPMRQFLQPARVSHRIGIPYGDIRCQRLRLGDRHASAQPARFGMAIERGDDASPSGAADQHQRCRAVKRSGVQLPFQAIRRPPGKVERYDPGHRRLPLQNLRCRQRGNG